MKHCSPDTLDRRRAAADPHVTRGRGRAIVRRHYVLAADAMVDATGVPIPESMTGRSVLPRVGGSDPQSGGMDCTVSTRSVIRAGIKRRCRRYSTA